MNDPTFGEMEFDVFWNGHASLDHFGGDLAIEIEAGNQGPTDKHRGVFTALVEIQVNLKSQIEEKVFEYYNSIRESYREAYDPDYVDQDVPIIEDSNKVWSLLNSFYIHIPEQEGNSWVVLLLWECSWDIEHGLGVKVIDGEVVDVGDHSI